MRKNNTNSSKVIKDMTSKLNNLLKPLRLRQRPKKLRLTFVAFVTLALSCLVNCVALPKPPNTPLCLYDNYSKSKDGKRDYSKSPVFHCSAANGTEFEIPWNSPSAKNMVSTPHDDYVRLNDYYKKLFDVLERELIKKAKR